MSNSIDINGSEVQIVDSIDSVGAYAVVYVDLSSPNNFPVAYGDMGDDIDVPFWGSHREGTEDKAVFGNGVGTTLKNELIMSHFKPNDGSTWRIPWETDTVIGVILWDNVEDRYMPVKIGDAVTVDMEDDFGGSNIHDARIDSIRGYGPTDVCVKVESIDGGNRTWIDPMSIRSLVEEGPEWDIGEDRYIEPTA